jgi:type IV pilus assembly protein PilV
MRLSCGTPGARACRQRGVTLIEVLVTMVIVAVGLLGLAGMQVRGLSIQKDAHGRAIATQLALDIADRMRSNTGAVTAGTFNFNTAYPTGAYTAPTAPDCESATCTATQQAQFDFIRWFARVRSGALPGGWARIAQVAGQPAWEVTLMWVETGFRTDATLRTALGSTCPAGTPAEVECLTVRVRP